MQGYVNSKEKSINMFCCERIFTFLLKKKYEDMQSLLKS